MKKPNIDLSHSLQTSEALQSQAEKKLQLDFPADVEGVEGVEGVLLDSAEGVDAKDVTTFIPPNQSTTQQAHPLDTRRSIDAIAHECISKGSTVDQFTTAVVQEGYFEEEFDAWLQHIHANKDQLVLK